MIFHIGSVAERSKALVLGTSQKWRGFESHRCHEYLFTCTLTDPDAGGMKAIEYLHHRIKGGSLQSCLWPAVAATRCHRGRFFLHAQYCPSPWSFRRAPRLQSPESAGGSLSLPPGTQRKPVLYLHAQGKQAVRLPKLQWRCFCAGPHLQTLSKVVSVWQHDLISQHSSGVSSVCS